MIPSSLALRLRDRFALALIAMTLAATASEGVRAWPSGASGAGFALLFLAQIVVASALWTGALALLLCGGVWLGRRIGCPVEPGRRWAAAVWIGPAVLAQITAGTWLLGWGARAFVREDLTAAVMPVLLLLAFAAIASAAWVGHRLCAERIARWPRWASIAASVAGCAAAAAIHLARFPEVLDAPFLPALVQLALVAALGFALIVWAPPLPVRPGWIGIAASALVWTGLFCVFLLAGRIAPLSHPVAAAAVANRGLMSAKIVPRLTGLGDRDGDGFGRWFGGLDCDDGDAAIHPLAADVPDDGIDQDCFEGDLAGEAVAEVASERAALRRPPAQQMADSAILITVDALRADAVGFGGAPQPSSPNLDRLAGESAVFTTAWSHAPMTRRAFPALLASRFPSNIHWLELASDYPYTVSHADNLYLAEVARDAGLRTAMAVPFGYAVNSRFDQGFEIKKVRPASKYKHEINANVIVDDAVEILHDWIEEGEETPPRFFMWLHFYEAHYPYHRHKKYGFGKEPFDRYLSEVRYIDEQIGRLLDELSELGLTDTTAVFFTSDHGEEFGEHGGKHHGDLYPEDLRVPLLIHVPGEAPRRIEQQVGLVDVAPTILDALGVSVPEQFDGDSLIAPVTGEPMPERPVFTELIRDRKVPRRIVALADDDWYLIVDFAVGARELFDLRSDPAAQRNLFIEAPDRARDMEEALRRYMALRIGPLRVSSEREAEAR